MILQIFCIVVMCSSRQDFEAEIFAERQVADWGVAPPARRPSIKMTADSFQKWDRNGVIWPKSAESDQKGLSQNCFGFLGFCFIHAGDQNRY